MVQRLTLAALLAVALAPAAAHAALPFQPCLPDPSDRTFAAGCATVPVPLDRSGAIPGTINLNVARLKGPDNATEAVLALAGGPGQAAVPLTKDFSHDLAAGGATRDLLVFDQRGTGGSGPLKCPGITAYKTSAEIVANCGSKLGPARAHYTTADSVEDIEAIRQAAGYSKLLLYGVSYGTKVALAYAAKYPQNVSGLILDSVVKPNGPDALRTSTLAAFPRVLGQLCADDACRGIATDPAGDVKKLAAKLAAKPITGSVYDGRGRALKATLTEEGLANAIIAGDLNPALRAALPGSLRAALSGDVKPILRLYARSAGLEDAYQAASADNDILFFTTECEEANIPWTRGAPLQQRAMEVANAAKAQAAESPGLFDFRAALGGIPTLCAPYPVGGPQPAQIGNPPRVPALILEGADDTRTTVEDAQSVAGLIGDASLVVVPHVGHSVLGSDQTQCSENAVNAFFAGQTPQQCAASPNPFPPTPKPPAKLTQLQPYPKTKGTSGRTVEAVRLTYNDARDQVIGAALALGRVPDAIGGLRGGYARPTSSGFSLHGYQEVPHVSVSGTVPTNGTATLRITGSAAARGTLRITNRGHVTGTLGGRRISTSYATTARVRQARWQTGGMTIAQAVARGRLRRAG